MLTLLGSCLIFLGRIRTRIPPGAYFLILGFFGVAFGFCGLMMSIMPSFILKREGDDGYLDLVGELIKRIFPEAIHGIAARFVGIAFIGIGVLFGNWSYGSYQYHHGTAQVVQMDEDWEKFLNKMDEVIEEAEAAEATTTEGNAKTEINDIFGDNDPESVPALQQPVQQPVGTIAQADQYIAQASVFWRQSNYQGALNAAQKGYEIYHARLGDQDPKTKQVLQMIQTARHQLSE